MANTALQECPDSGSGQFNGTPFGGDKDPKNHFQPADLGQASRVLPGEQPDPNKNAPYSF